MAAVEVSIDELDSWLRNQPNNTIDTPYVIKITGLTSENLTKIKSSLERSGTKYVDLSETNLPSGIRSLQGIFSSCMNLVKSPEIPNTVTNLEDCFFACIHLLEAPVIPDSVTNLRRTFQGCSSLVKTPVLPNNITTLFGTFKGCTSLTEVSNFPNSLTDLPHAFFNCSSLRKVPEFPQGITNLYYAFTGATALTDLHLEDFFKFYSITSDKYAFTGCTNLKNFYTNYPYACKEWVKGLYNKGDRFPNDPDSCNFITYVSYSDLDYWLSTQVENSISSPYKVIITDIAPQDCESIGKIIQDNGRYVDLSDTILPEGLTSLMIDGIEDGIFERCEYLVEPPVLPSTLTSAKKGFRGCTSLKTAPVIPDTVTDLERAFENCSSLTEPPVIPDSVTDLTETFSDCSSLTYKVAANHLESDTYYGVSTTHWKGRADQLQYLFAEDEDVTEYEILETGQVLHFENGALVIPISELDSALQSLSENTAGSAYKIKVTELTTENIGDIKTALRNNPAKYVNLSLTVLPEVTSLNECFSQCSTLVESPVLPNGLEEMVRMFLDCENLKRFPLIPTTVTNMDDAFYGCSSVDGEIILPPNLTEMWSTFQGCSSLSITPVIPENVIKMNGTFCGCASLPEFPDIPDGVIQLVDTFEGCVLVKDPPVLPNNNIIFESTFLNCTSLKTPPVIPDSTESMIRMFGGCSSLEEVPEIPSTVTSMWKAFEGCTSISETSIIPSSVVEFGKAFSGCTALTTAKLSKLNYEVLEEELSEQKLIFEGCSNLQTVYTDEPYELKSFFSHLSEKYEGSTPDPDTLTYKLLSSPAEIPLTNLSNDLATLEENTLETPFNIKITDININNLSEFKTALTANPTKFVDLHETILPQNVSEFNGTFEDCTTLIKAPAIPESATDIGGMFANCSNLEELPEIPNGVEIMSGAFTGCSKIEEVGAIPPSVTNMYAAFMDCTSLKTVSIIPESVTVFSQAFNGCSALERIDEFNLPMSVLQSSASGCFNGCTSLTSIIIPTSEVITNDNWHIVMLEFGPTTVKGKVFDYDPETKQTTVHVIPETTVEKNKMTLLQITDELWFPETETAEDIEDLIERIIENRYGYYNKTVIPPDKKSFVLYAADKNSVISNLDLGGGGEGQGLAFIGTEAEFKEALRIPFGEQGYIYPNSLSLITDKSNYLVGEIHNE